MNGGYHQNRQQMAAEYRQCTVQASQAKETNTQQASELLHSLMLILIALMFKDSTFQLTCVNIKFEEFNKKNTCSFAFNQC